MKLKTLYQPIIAFSTFNAIFIFNIKEKTMFEELKKYYKNVETGASMLLKQVSMYQLVFPFQYVIHLILNMQIMNNFALGIGIA